nr:unnamed protein product [Fasciola hepatica]
MSTERDVALTSEPSPSNVQEKGNSGKSNNQEWRIYDDPALINFGAKKHLKETDVPVEAKLATDISFSAANIEPVSNELALALSSLLDEYSDTAEYSASQSSV